MPKGKRITEEIKKEVYSHYKSGKNNVEIAKIVGISDHAVGDIIRRIHEKKKVCPTCGLESKVDARYCWWCGGDIRSEADKLLERVVSMRVMIHHLPENMKSEFDGVTRDVIKYLEEEAHGQH